MQNEAGMLRGPDAKPGTSHQEEVIAILHAAINLCSLTLLLFDIRACGMFTFTQSMVTSKNVSQGTHHVRKSSRPRRLALGAARLGLLQLPRAQFSSLETRPSPSAIIITLTFEPYRSYGGRRPGRFSQICARDKRQDRHNDAILQLGMF